MNILMLGGTGPIGTAFTETFQDHNVTITTRRKRKPTHSNIRYVKLNGMNNEELYDLLNTRFDVVIDFMNYNVELFESRYKTLLEKTNHYIFLSSARVYSDDDFLINNRTARLLDSDIDLDYRMSQEYAISKAMQEDLLLQSDYDNYTIIRPYITYHYNRLQFGPFEKEDWLMGVIKHRCLVVYDNMLEKTTTMTSAIDVAKIIIKTINLGANNRIINAASSEHLKWGEVLLIYKDEVRKQLGIDFKVISIPRDELIKRFGHDYQIRYDRDYDRRFLNDSSIEHKYIPIDISLRSSISKFLISEINNITMNCEYEKELLLIKGLNRNLTLLRFNYCRLYHRLKSIFSRYLF